MFILHEVFCLAYFVAKNGEKMIYLHSLYVCVFCIYFVDLPIMPILSAVAFILQLFQVVCRCCHRRCNILMFLKMI